MWERAELKDKAKQVLKGNYWQAFIVSLIILITGGSHNHGEVGSARGSEAGNILNLDYRIAFIVGAVILLFVLIRMFIGYAFEVGGRKYFIKLSEGESDITNLGYAFKKNRYINVFITMLLRSVYLILWTLLLIIPGIIKFYAYRMVPYLLADNPEIGHRRAVKLSNEMTRGEKWDIFVLDSSFLGWFILGSLVFGVGIFFVQPYYDATNAELYLKLRQTAIANDLTLKSELNIEG
ncbi:MAG: DUF975 family protein [Bacillota bacterium]